MKVTKLIREYVEEEVKKAIPATDLCPEYVAMREATTAREQEIEERVKAYAKQLCAEGRKDLHLPDDWTLELSRSYYSIVQSNGFNSALHQKNCQMERAAKERREATIKDILLDMELGEINRKNLGEAIQAAIERN